MGAAVCGHAGRIVSPGLRALTTGCVQRACTVVQSPPDAPACLPPAGVSAAAQLGDHPEQLQPPVQGQRAALPGRCRPGKRACAVNPDADQHAGRFSRIRRPYTTPPSGGLAPPGRHSTGCAVVQQAPAARRASSLRPSSASASDSHAQANAARGNRSTNPRSFLARSAGHPRPHRSRATWSA
jgi:hypothetical protein